MRDNSQDTRFINALHRANKDESIVTVTLHTGRVVTGRVARVDSYSFSLEYEVEGNVVDYLGRLECIESIERKRQRKKAA